MIYRCICRCFHIGFVCKFFMLLHYFTQNQTLLLSGGLG
jgi:hypothetical protein